MISLDIKTRIKSNLFWQFINESIGRGIIVLSNLYLARKLGVEHFGLYALIQTVIMYLWLFVDMGTGMYGTRELSFTQRKISEVVFSIFSLRLFLGTILFIIILGIIYLFYWDRKGSISFIIGGVYLISYCCYGDWVFRGLEKFKYLASGTVVVSLFSVTGILLFVKNAGDLNISLVIWVLSYFVGSVCLAIVMLKAKLVTFGFKYIDIGYQKEMLAESSSIFINSLFVLAYQNLSMIILGLLCSNYDVGIYTAPYRIIINISSVGFLIAMGLYPIFSEQFKNNKKEFMRIHRAFQLSMLVCFVILSMLMYPFSDDIIITLFGGQYGDSIPVFNILLIYLPVICIRFTYGTVLLAMGCQKLLSFGSLVGLGISIVLSYFLIDKFMAVGAAMSLLLSEIMLVLIYGSIFNYFIAKNTEKM